MLEKYTSSESDFYFSPDSIIWKVNRERILVLCGGQRTLLMQLAHPLVAQAISDHSSFKKNPLERLKHTRELMSTLMFGTKEEVFEAARKINNAHKPVKGNLEQAIGAHDAGTPYNAKNPELTMWVWATFTDSSLVVYDKFVGRLRDNEREKFYQEAKRVLPLLGGKPKEAPSTVKEFSGYMEEMIQTGEVAVSQKAKDLAPYLMLKKSFPTKILTPPLSLITAGLLQEELRSQYGFRWNPAEQKLLDIIAAISRQVYPYIPDELRFSPKYLKSRKRIES